MAWAKKVSSVAPSNSKVIFFSTTEELQAKLNSLCELFDLLVVDVDADRIEYCKIGLKLLNKNGVVIWDDTNGPDWPSIKKILEGFGFREISFLGMTPQTIHVSRTSIFYREGNCLEI